MERIINYGQYEEMGFRLDVAYIDIEAVAPFEDTGLQIDIRCWSCCVTMRGR